MNPLIVKLERRDRLSEEEKAALDTIVSPLKRVRSGTDLVREGERPRESILVIEGFAGRYNTLHDGGRQISAIHVAGDFVDLHSFLLHVMDHGVIALGPCSIATVSHDALRSVTREFPHLTRLLWLSTLIDAAIHRRWLVAMGRQPSAAQLAHLLCELHVRLGVVGLTDQDTFELPLSQSEIGDVLGLSLVHVNRIVQELKRTGLISWVGRKIAIRNVGKLRELAEFNPMYLHLETESR
jgi:CRP-like cAMP-binding protein